MANYRYELAIVGLWYGEWELETWCEDRSDARRLLKEYRENQPEVPHKIQRKRCYE